MSERDLIQALQELVARHSRPVDAHSVSSELISRDRLRIRMLGGVTALLWLGGIAGILYMVFCFNRFIIAYSPATPTDIDQPHVLRAGDEFGAKMELHHSLEACMVALPVILLAALCTVGLVFSSRRATLNQINLNLAEISRQLRELRPPVPARESG